MKSTRKQLTLFINPVESQEFEQIRREFNPLQSDLIAAHVTLCHEDEIEDIEQIRLNLRGLIHEPVTISFGDVVRFDNGNGVLLPAIGENNEFRSLRKSILGGAPRNHQPHITLMHPRNSKCTDEFFEQIQSANFPAKLTFDKISLIEQIDGGKWEILEEFPIGNYV